jgi:LysR family glycine cleavage system transcriptional activator
LGTERITALCAPALKDRKRSWREVIGELTLIDSQLNQVTWRDWFSLNGLRMPDRPHQSFDRGALSISAAVDGMGVALESTRFAERELARGDLVEVGPTVFKPLHREMHFFSQRINERHIDKIQQFKKWLLEQVHLSERGSRRAVPR